MAQGETTMKKLLTLLFTLVLTAGCLLGLTACGKETKYVVNALVGAQDEQYGFIVGKNASKKDDILSAMNKVISENDIDKLVSYFTSVSKNETPTVTVPDVDLSSCTGGTLKVYTNSGFEPYEFYDSNNNLVGVDMYLMLLVGKELNMKVTFEDIDFAFIIGKVQTEDNAVGAAGLTIDPERDVAFSDAYYSSVQCIISAEGDGFTTLESLKGKKIAVQKGTTGNTLILDAIQNGVLKDSGAKIIESKDGATAFASLKQGKCDVVVIDELPAKKLVG